MYDSTCKLSQKFWDVHDFPISKGGGGTPSHFHTYECPKCKVKFGI